MLRFALQCIFAATLLLPKVALAEPTVLKLSLFTSDRSNIYRLQIKPFVDAVNAEGKGLVQIKVYFSGALGKTLAQQTRLVDDGTADLALIVPGYTPTRFPDTAVVELPGLFPNTETASRIYTWLLQTHALKGYDDYFAINGFVSAGESIHSRKPIASLSDLRGQTIRTNNDIEDTTLTKLGAVPVRLSISRTLDTISQGKLDGAAVPPAMLFEFGIGRVTDHHYMMRLGGAPIALVMNRKKLDEPPGQCASDHPQAQRRPSGFAYRVGLRHAQQRSHQEIAGRPKAQGGVSVAVRLGRQPARVRSGHRPMGRPVAAQSQAPGAGQERNRKTSFHRLRNIYEVDWEHA